MYFEDSDRTHDLLYATEDQFSNPKEYFKETISIIRRLHAHSDSELRLLDIGCAAGDFLRYAASVLIDIEVKLYGTDVMPELIDAARTRFPECTFNIADITDKQINIADIHKTEFDVITMLGVHSIFDDLTCVERILEGLAPNGCAILYGIFNPLPYDLLMRVKKSGETNLEPGWNVHSKKTVSELVSAKGFVAKFIDYEPDIMIPINSDDSLRTWTVELSANNTRTPESDRKRLFTNATRIIHDWSFCLISQNSDITRF
ncbi:MAG: hypothetical protein CL886_03650 [Dehalococcoidia bacterium]|nr:hypothetical protein [Dehalococcoidia bacterium]|tara:strand:- start:3004 stop:3783 length:780 start_codon:yes stop_codon:yes gene_type:complete